MKTKLFILAIVILTLLASCGSKTTAGEVVEKEKIVRASGEHINIVTLISNDEQRLIEVTSTVFDIIVLGQRYEFECVGGPSCKIFSEVKLQEGGKKDQ